jgi:tRNA nucleotidyltransferase (CCA-adding enzyme)
MFNLKIIENIKSNLDKNLIEIFKLNSLLVGGFIRDIILNRTIKELDLVIQSKKYFPNLKFNSLGSGSLYVETKSKIDFSLPRKEIYFNKKTIHEVYEYFLLDEIPYIDVFRRDFTINSLYADFKGNIVDPLYCGIKHINEGLIEVIDPLSFFKDPSRVIRAIRYAKMLNFNLTTRTSNLLTSFLNSNFNPDKFARRRIKLEIERTLDLLSYNEIKEVLYSFGTKVKLL